MSTLDFTRKKPEEAGINSSWIVNFLKRLEQYQLPIHSFILMKDDAVVAETYYAPYTADTNHRMFSITKSFTSIAIGLLADEGLLSLDDKIISHFPEKLKGEPTPHLAAMTIRDMLCMASCYAFTTYKVMECTDWVESFFTATPDHMPGTTFSYDTSATLTLCALVEKLTGIKLLDFLKKKFLNEAGFSKDSYILPVQSGVSHGGSGLMCTSMDLLKFMYILSNNGRLGDRQVIPEDYVKAATSKQIDTFAKTSTWEEMQGYGYQFWRTTHNGFACYGTGGQYAVFYPDYNMIFITSADTQGRQGGTQLIYDTFYQEILEKIGHEDIINGEIAGSDYEEFLATRKLFHIEGNAHSPILSSVNNCRYTLDSNPMGFKWVALEINEADSCGALHYANEKGEFALEFGIGHNADVTFPDYNYRAAVSGAFRDDSTFLIKAQLIDECIGNIFIQLIFKDDTVTLMMRKFEETMFNEFDGFVSGHRE